MPRKKKTKKAKPVKMEEVKEQIDGKEWRRKHPRRLADILGHYEDKFKAESEDDYKEILSDMNIIDLQKECVRIGLMPTQNRDVMVGRILEQYRLNLACEKARLTEAVKLPTNKKVNEILSKGANRLV